MDMDEILNHLLFRTKQIPFQCVCELHTDITRFLPKIIINWNELPEVNVSVSTLSQISLKNVH